MGKLIRNGIEYGGGNGTDIFEVTQAEYDALVQAGTLVHNALYVITDAPNLNPTASDIEYSSGVTVKQKIDDLYKGEQVTITPNTTGISTNNTYAYSKGKLVVLSVDVVFSSDYLSQWKDIATISNYTLDGAGYFGLITTENGDNTFIQVYQSGTDIVLRGRNVKTYGGNNLRGQIVFPIV